MADLLVDTDVLVDHLRGTTAIAAPFPDAYSIITRAELSAGRGSEEADVRALLAPMRELVLTTSIAERAGRIRRETRILMPDALIAATALEHGLSLLTRNRRDFAGVRGLRVVAPKHRSRR